MVDVRARGGYVLGAGSAVDGKRYEVLDDMPPAPLPGWIARALTSRPEPSGAPRRVIGTADARLRGLADTVRRSQPGDRTCPLVWAAHRLAEMIADSKASPDDGELLIGAAVEAGIRGGEQYARGQVQHVPGAAP